MNPSHADELLPCVELEPPGEARSSVIWLHGLGADGHDFVPIVPDLGLDPELGVRFVFPHAPRIPVSINMGFVMPAWYDIRAADLRREPDREGVLRSADQVRRLIEREQERGIPSDRIVLAGFSQGGAIALYLGLRHDATLAGVIALSTYLLLEESLESEAHEANRATPIFQAHGSIDPMVPSERGEAARQVLEAAGYAVEWHSYPMQHQVCMEEIHELGAWLTRCLGGRR